MGKMRNFGKDKDYEKDFKLTDRELKEIAKTWEKAKEIMRNEEKKEDKWIKKVIWFSTVTTISVLIWAEIIGMDVVVYIAIIILVILFWRWFYDKR